MSGRGLQYLAWRIPQEWDPEWFRQMLIKVFAKADVRNAIGDGISVTGQPDELGTLAIQFDGAQLMQAVRSYSVPPPVVPDLREGAHVTFARDAQGIVISGPSPDDAEFILAGRIFKR